MGELRGRWIAALVVGSALLPILMVGSWFLGMRVEGSRVHTTKVRVAEEVLRHQAEENPGFPEGCRATSVSEFNVDATCRNGRQVRVDFYTVGPDGASPSGIQAMDEGHRWQVVRQFP